MPYNLYLNSLSQARNIVATFDKDNDTFLDFHELGHMMEAKECTPLDLTQYRQLCTRVRADIKFGLDATQLLQAYIDLPSWHLEGDALHLLTLAPATPIPTP
eukprot:CAMPEP_0167802844 /NCGR_PEP_ID=MMETSP0111_2-20121227/19391_1 /TAXON_ID=91324 /ORGANISM="Lotharella globosa, Strain CCCM811" /LENGTH=101 /DNA_ID=CAMNT_0007699017 /DNA_START=106 /DNA_END=408 /DNA_ORIENTATION=+